jgi:hypothetical protein
MPLDGTYHDLTVGERNLLGLFASHPGRVLSADTVRFHLRKIVLRPDVIAQSLVGKGLLRAIGEGPAPEGYAAIVAPAPSEDAPYAA